MNINNTINNNNGIYKLALNMIYHLNLTTTWQTIIRQIFLQSKRSYTSSIYS